MSNIMDSIMHEENQELVYEIQSALANGIVYWDGKRWDHEPMPCCIAIYPDEMDNVEDILAEYATPPRELYG